MFHFLSRTVYRNFVCIASHSLCSRARLNYTHRRFLWFLLQINSHVSVTNALDITLLRPPGDTALCSFVFFLIRSISLTLNNKMFKFTYQETSPSRVSSLSVMKHFKYCPLNSKTTVKKPAIVSKKLERSLEFCLKTCCQVNISQCCRIKFPLISYDRQRRK